MSRLPGLPARKAPVIKPSLTVFGAVRQPSSKIFPQQASCTGFYCREYCFGFHKRRSPYRQVDQAA
jgi:hypothetical protein